MKKIRRFRGERAGIEQLVSWIGVVGVIIVFGLLYVWQQIQTRDLKRDIIQMEARKAELIQKNSRLHMEIIRLSSLDRIEMVAMGQFQMVYPVVGQVIEITDEASSLPPPYAMEAEEGTALTASVSSRRLDSPATTALISMTSAPMLSETH